MNIRTIAGGVALLSLLSAGIANAQATSPSLVVSFSAPQTTSVSSLSLFGIVTLDASTSSDGIKVYTIPTTITAGSNASLGYLSACAVRNASNLGAPLNTGINAVNSFTTGPLFTLDTPITVPAGQKAQLAITCAVSSSAPLGAKYFMSVTPSSVQARTLSGDTTIQPSAGSPTSGTVTISTSTSTTTPGVPNTGAGGDGGANFVVLTLSALALLLAAAYASYQAPALRR